MKLFSRITDFLSTLLMETLFAILPGPESSALKRELSRSGKFHEEKSK